MLNLEKNIFLNGNILCETGLHIGGTKESVEIGGGDNPIIMDPNTKRPVIPGSSLKGKMRTLIEFKEGKLKEGKQKDGEPHSCDEEDCQICIVFGNTSDKLTGPTRLIVRDSILDRDVTTEVKTENMINRLMGKAKHPRDIDRVPAGTEFGFEMVLGIYSGDGLELLRYPLLGLALLQNSYLGGSGTRGYGRVKFSDIDIRYRDASMYDRGEPPQSIGRYANPDEVLMNFDEIIKALRGS